MEKSGVESEPMSLRESEKQQVVESDKYTPEIQDWQLSGM